MVSLWCCSVLLWRDVWFKCGACGAATFFSRLIYGLCELIVVLQRAPLERYMVSVRCLWCCSSLFTREIHGLSEVLVVLQLLVY